MQCIPGLTALSFFALGGTGIASNRLVILSNAKDLLFASIGRNQVFRLRSPQGQDDKPCYDRQIAECISPSPPAPMNLSQPAKAFPTLLKRR
jgi:hypothetical protein